jgi:hypothetical protein
MADEDIDEEFEEATLDVEEIDEEEILEAADDEDSDFVAEGDLAVVDSDLAVVDGDLAVVEVVVDDAVVAVPAEAAPKARKKRDEEEEDEDEADPDDVEADLDKILKERIAANEDEDEDEELEEQAPRTVGETADGVQPKKANEFMCTGCFLLVNAAQFGPPDQLECPVGESVCPALKLVEKQYQKARK